MTISLGNAIKCITEDEKWKKKILVGGLVYLVTQIAAQLFFHFATQGNMPNITSIVSIVITIIAGLWLSGFLYASYNKTMNSDKFQMAELNEKNLMLVGFKVIFATLGWGILNVIILTIVGLIYAVVAAIIVAIIFGLLGLCIGFENQILSICISIFMILAGILFGLYYAQFINTAFAFYIKRLKFSDFISFRKHLTVIIHNQHANWTLVGKMILYTLTTCAISIGLAISIIGIIVLPFFIFTCNFICFNLITQYAKEVDIEKYLNIDIFVRCHNSFIVNFEKVRRFDRSEFIMRNGESVSISRSRYSEVKERFDKWAAMQRLGE